MAKDTYRNIKSCNYTMEEPQFNDISFSAKEFISRLLVIDQVNYRPSSTRIY